MSGAYLGPIFENGQISGFLENNKIPYQELDKAKMPEKVAGSYKLIGYLFWINASWFICGETAKLHFKPKRC